MSTDPNTKSQGSEFNTINEIDELYSSEGPTNGDAYDPGEMYDENNDSHFSEEDDYLVYNDDHDDEGYF